MSLCSTCGKRIIWCRTELGKKMPIDPEPTPDGNLVLVGGELLPTVRSASRNVYQPGQALYKSHFATCKEIAAHRKRRGFRNKESLPPPGPVLFEEPPSC